MRGRVLILLGLIILGAVAVGALLLLNGDDSGNQTPTATAEGIVDGGNNNGGDQQPAPTNSGGQPSSGNALPVVVALQNLPRGKLITVNDIVGLTPDGQNQNLIDVRYWDARYLPQTRIEDVTELIGCIVRTDIARESPILPAQLTADTSLLGDQVFGGQVCRATQGDNQPIARTGSDASLMLQSTMVGISIPVDPTGLGQVAYALQPGDHIDVNMSFLFIDVDETFQTRRPNTITVITILEDGTIGFTEPRLGREEPSNNFPNGIIVGPSEEQQRPRLVTQRTIQNALVIHVGWFPPDGIVYGATPTAFEVPEVVAQPTTSGSTAPVSLPATSTPYMPMILTIGVTPQDALVMTWAMDSNIPITLTLRPAVGSAALDDPTEAVSLEYILREFGIDDPPKLPVAVEPAITNIRRFDLNTVRTFTDISLSQ